MKGRWIVAYKLKEPWRQMGETELKFQHFPKQQDAWELYDRLKGRTKYRVLSFGFGHVYAEQGRLV